MRVRLDANVLVSAVLSPRGASRALLQLALHGEIEIVTSAVLLAEAEEVFSRFMSRGAAAEVRAALKELAVEVQPLEVPFVSRDRDDDHVLAAARSGNVAYVVTRDRDLLTLDTYEGIPILEPRPGLQAIRTDLRGTSG